MRINGISSRLNKYEVGKVFRKMLLVLATYGSRNYLHMLADGILRGFHSSGISSLRPFYILSL